MDVILVILGGILILAGILGSFLPVVPGIPVSWIGLLLLFFTSVIPMDYLFLGITFLVTLLVYAMQYVVPAWGARYFGGSKKGMIGAGAGLVVGIFIPLPGGIFLGTFAGAFLGEILNKRNSKIAVKAAFGSFVGLLASNFMEFLACFIFMLLFLNKVWEYRHGLFSF